MILLIDNYDSFTYNIVQSVGLYDNNIKVVRNDKFSIKDIENWQPSHIIISPGPGRPENAGESIKVIKKYGAVSVQCCLSMVNNLSKISNSHINISITGIAGPKGGTRKKPVGLVFIGLKFKKKIFVKKYLFKNKSRTNFQKITVNKVIKIALSTIK